MGEGDTSGDFVLSTLRVALRPLVRYALRNSLRLLDLVEVMKAVLLDVAAEELRRADLTPNVSRLSVMTGVHRKDTTRLYREGEAVRRPGDTFTRIVGQWRYNKRFGSSAGKPKVLSCAGVKSEFAELVRSVTSDMAPMTILSELERRKMVTRRGGRVQLLVTANLTPAVTRDAVARGEGFRTLAEDVRDLLSAGEENLREGGSKARHLQLKTEFDNIPENRAEELRGWLMAEGSAFHRRVESHLAKYDRDITPSADAGRPVRVAFGSFSFIDRENVGGLPEQREIAPRRKRTTTGKA